MVAGVRSDQNAARWCRTRGSPPPTRRLDHDQVEPDRQPRQVDAVGQHASIEQAVRRHPDVRPLAVVDGLLRQPEAPRRAPADLDDHERGRRTRVDRHEIELVAADMDVPGQDGPARRREGGPGPAIRRRHLPAGQRSGVGEPVEPSMRRMMTSDRSPVTYRPTSPRAYPVHARAREGAFRRATTRARPGRRHRAPHRRP